MSVHPALTAPEIAALAGPSTANWHLSVVNSTRVTRARINQVSFTYPLAQLTVDGTDANWALQQPGMRVDIGSTLDGSDKGIYRVRLPQGGTTVFIGETSAGDAGLITQSIRTAGFADDDYVTVYLDEFDLTSVAPRFANGGQIYEDYDRNVNNNNTYPEPIVNIAVNGGTRWADYVDDGQTYRTIVLVASVGPTANGWVTSASVAYHWFTPTGWTLTAGNVNTNTVTYRVPSSVQNYTIECDVTENNGTVAVAYRNVWAHDRATNAPLALANVNSVVWDRTTMKASFTLNDKVLANLRPGAMVNLWFEGTWSGVDVPTAPTQFVGWVVSQTEHVEGGLGEATVNIEGVCGVMARIGAYSQYFIAGSPANTWQTVVTSLAYVDFWIWWCIRHRAANILTLFNYTALGISNLTGRLPQSKIPVAPNLLSQVQALTQSYTANIGSNPDGEIMVRLHPNLQSSRGAIVNRGTLSASIYTVGDMERTFIPTVRKVRGEGFYWDGSSAVPTPYLTDAPGDAPGQGTREERLQGQFIDNQADLDTRTALYYFMLNNPLANIPLQIMKNYGVFYPAEMQFMAYTCPANLHPSGTAINMKGVPITCSLKWNNDSHLLDFDMSIEGETSTGIIGTAFPIPPALPTTPFVSVPTGGTTISCLGTNFTITFFGDCCIVCDGTNIRLVKGVATGVVSSIALPIAGLPAGAIFDVQPDPFGSWWTTHSGTAPAYALADSGVYVISDLLDCTKSWTLYQGLSHLNSGFPQMMRVDHGAVGNVVVNWWQSTVSGSREITRINSGGVVWHQSIGGRQFDPQASAMDIDQTGLDVVWAATVGSFGDANVHVYKITNGGTPVLKRSFTWAFQDRMVPAFIQISGTTVLLAMQANNNRQNLVYSTDEFATITDISQADHINPAQYMSSMIPVDNPNIMTMAVVPYAYGCTVPTCSNKQGLYMSTNRGVGWSFVSGSSLASCSQTSGYFPIKVNGQYQIYTGGDTLIGYLPSLSSSLLTRTPDWSVAGPLRTVFPIS